MTTAENTTVAPAAHHWLRIALAIVALIELVDALSSVHNIFTDYHHTTCPSSYLSSQGLALVQRV